jgi:phenylacetate-CoA ligase
MKAALPERVMWTMYLARHLLGQSRFPYLPPAAIERAQSRRVRKMVSHAFRTVPYYRETMTHPGLLPHEFLSARDLSRLPVIEREQLQRDPEYFQSDSHRMGEDLESRSGGSTGAPRGVKWDTAAIFQNAAHAERERSIIAQAVGRFVNYRETVIGSLYGSDREIQQLYADRAILPSRSRVQYQNISLLDSPDTNIPLLNEFRPDVIRSYGSYLDRLFTHVHATGAVFHKPKVVFYDADELPERARRLIADEFGICILSAYQAVEAFKIGFECEQHSGIHLNADLYPVRLVDDDLQEVVAGESGEVVVSNLVNRATVLLNYRLGDVAHMLPAGCACGRTLPLMSFIEGRTDDWVTLSSGEAIHPQSIRTLFTNERKIFQYQVIQRRLDHFTVALAGIAENAILAERIVGRFRDRFGQAVSVDVAFVASIEPSVGGKIRPVISLVGSGA